MSELALTIDLEFLEENYFGAHSEKETAQLEKEGVRKLLNILRRHDQKITFFTVASLCDNHLGLLEEIRDAGHEIACHSYTHPNLTASSVNLEKEIKESKSRLEEDLGIEVKGFRAPVLRINEEINKKIEGAGYVYDSSEQPSIRIPGWYGGGSKFKAYRKGDITEIPVSAHPLFKTPISGFFFRTLGITHAKSAIDILNREDVTPVMFIHPYELSKFEQKANWRQKWRTGGYTLKAIEKLSSEYRLCRVDSLLEDD